MYTTELTLKVAVSTQFGPSNAVNMMQILLTNVPAIKQVDLVDLKTDWVSDPAYPKDRNIETLNSIPITLVDRH